MTSERLSNLSCNEDEFIKALDEYQNLLKKSGFKDKLVYTSSNQRNRGQGNRKFIWYNSSFDLQVKTNIGKNCLQLLDRNSSPHHRLHKIINKNTVKISYSCILNMGPHISSHNKSIIQESKKSQNLNPKTFDC